MANVLLAHSNPNFRISLARELEGRGFQVAGYADIEGALDAVATEACVALLVEPALLMAEEFELGARLEVRAGRMLPILALAHKATTQEMSVFRRHSAGLLARPLEDLDRLARQLTNLAESAPPAPANAPWDAQGGTAEAAKPARPVPTGGIVETVGTGRRRRKRGNTDVTSDDTATSAPSIEPERPPTPTSYATPPPAPVAVPVPVPASPPAPDLFEAGSPEDTETVVASSSPVEPPGAPPSATPMPPAYAPAPPPAPPAPPSAPAPESSPLDAILARPPFPDEGAEALSTSILPPDALGPEPVIPPPPPRAPLPPVEIPPPSPDWTPPPAARSGDPAADVMPTGRTDAFFARSIEVDRAVPIGGSEDAALEDDVDAPAPPTDEMPVEDFYAPVERPAVVSPPAWETRVDPPADAATRVESEPEEAEPPADGGDDADAGADVAYFDTFVTPNDMPLLEGSFRAPVSRPPSPPAADLDGDSVPGAGENAGDGADPSDAIADGGGTVVSTPFEADHADAMPEQTPIDEIDGPSPKDDGAAPPATAIESAGEGDPDAARALEEELFGDSAGPQTTIAELPKETGARPTVPAPADPSSEEGAEASAPSEREKPRDRKSRKEKKKDKRAKKDEAKRAKKSKEKDRDREKERPKAPATPMPVARASEDSEPSPSRPSGRAAVVRVVIEDTDPRDALSAAREDAAARDGWEIERNAHDGVEGTEDAESAEDAVAPEDGDADRSAPSAAGGVLAREAPDDDRTQTSAPGRAPAEPSGVLAREAPDEDRTETRAPPVAPSRGGVVAREAPEEEGTIRSPGPRGGTRPAESLPSGTEDEHPDGTLVLVVDDEPAFRGFLRDALVSQGYLVHTAINAPNALRFLKANNHVDLVISDLNMPHMDGFELKHEIDQWVARKLPFIVVTADPSDEKIEIAAQVGASALVPKPIDDLDAFYSIVAETLRDAGIDVPEPPPAAKK